MRNLFRFATAAAVLSMSFAAVAAHAEEFVAATPTFSDSSSGSNNDYNFTGSFAHAIDLSGGVGASETDQLTINPGTAGCFYSFSCGSATSDSLSVTVDFTLPSAKDGDISGTGTFSAFISDGAINWTNNTDLVTFSDGSSVLLSLPDIQGLPFDLNNQGNLTENLTVTVESVATAATPEPSSLLLLGTGLLGSVGMLRRRFSL